MSCSQCIGIEESFNQKYVNQELSRYRKKGPSKTTRMLVDAIESEAPGVEGLTLLDIGGGVGAIQHALLEAGVEKVTSVDASSAYINAANSEAERRGVANHVSYHYGNFVDLAGDIAPADIVTLDRVICCFDDMHNLVGLSAARARNLYGLVYPRDTWWIRLGLAIANIFCRIRRSKFRAYSHPSNEVEAILRRSGLHRRSYQQTLIWQVVVFAR